MRGTFAANSSQPMRDTQDGFSSVKKGNVMVRTFFQLAILLNGLTALVSLGAGALERDLLFHVSFDRMI